MARRSARAPGGVSVSARLGFLGALLALLYGLMALYGTWTPRLGLDLQGGTSVILTPRSTTGGSVDSGALDKAVDIIRQRVDGLGVAEAEVRRAGETIEISVPGRGRNDVVDLVGQTAELRFREVYYYGPAQATAAEPSAEPSAEPTPAPTGSPAPSATPTPSAQASPSAQPSAASSAPAGGETPAAAPRADLGGTGSSSAVPAASAARSGLQVQPAVGSGGMQVQPAAATAPAATPTAEPSATPAPTPSATPSPGSTDSGQATGAAGGDTPPDELWDRFDKLTCTATDPTSGTGSLDRPEDWIVACDRTGTTKYLLKPASVVGTDVSTASAGLLSSGGTTNVTTGQWVVNVEFTGEGQKKFTKLTEETIGKQVAIVLDGVVQSAPQINERIAGSAQISGTFTRSEAEDLADVLKFGALPLAFERSQAESISPTLGRDSLNAGLLAGALGLALVIIYAVLYYRALSIVVILSLAISGLLVYASVTLLGEMIGFTLTLAGIAGLIVSIGTTADSFVVYFERIKDEIKAGRTVRPAVERAWPPARRTTLSANTVSFIAAAVLYVLSVGSVRGFAFTLGLSTLIDLLIMFIFTRPMVTLLVRTRFFGTSRFSGLAVASLTGAGSGAGRPRLAKRTEPAGFSAGGSAGARAADGHAPRRLLKKTADPAAAGSVGGPPGGPAGPPVDQHSTTGPDTAGQRRGR